MQFCTLTYCTDFLNEIYVLKKLDGVCRKPNIFFLSSIFTKPKLQLYWALLYIVLSTYDKFVNRMN